MDEDHGDGDDDGNGDGDDDTGSDDDDDYNEGWLRCWWWQW